VLVGDRCNRHRANLREDINLQAPERIFGGLFPPACQSIDVPFLRQFLERLRGLL